MNRTTGEIIKTDFSIKTIEPNDGKYYSLEELQEYVDGYIEMLYSSINDVYMIINEEGKLNDLPVNTMATEIFRQDFDGLPNDYISGDAVVVPSETIKK